MEQTIGAKIRELRKARGLTQKELGERAGIAEPTIRRYELGKLNPKFETVQKIAKALNVPEAFFYPIDEQIETAKREAKSELWAAETLARDNGKPWDVPTYNQERERVILDMSRRYSVAPEILLPLSHSVQMMNIAKVRYILTPPMREAPKVKPGTCSTRCNPMSKRKPPCRLQ